jgi:hypothetical protein
MGSYSYGNGRKSAVDNVFLTPVLTDASVSIRLALTTHEAEALHHLTFFV